MNGADIAFAIGLPPEKAVEHLRAKGLQVSEGWRTVAAQAHARAFTVANVAQLDVVADIQAELVRAIDGGLTIQQFRDNLQPMLERKGWFARKGESVRVPDGTPPDPVTGELATKKRLTARRLQTIFETNMNSAMSAGRFREMAANANNRPWWQWSAVLDGKTRPTHRAMNGRTFRFDDVINSGMWAPCGYRCRCFMRALSNEDVAELGVKTDATVGRPTVDRHTLADGTTQERVRFEFKNGGSFSPDAGFNVNPAMEQAVDRLAVAKAPLVLGQIASEQALRKLFTARQRLDDLANFVQTAQEARRSIGARAAVGALDEAAVLKLADEGVDFDQTRPVTLLDSLVGGRKAGRHAEAGDAPAVEDWANLPRVLAFGEMRWDVAERRLVYFAPALAPNDERTVLRVAVRAAPSGNEVVHAALVPANLVDAKANGRPRFEKVRPADAGKMNSEGGG